MHRLGSRLILDQLDQVVAVDDLARRNRDRLAGHERVAPRRPGAGHQALPVLGEQLPPAYQVGPALRGGRREHLGIGPGEIRRRHHVQDLARHERHHALMVARYARHAGRRLLPPLLGRQERLRDRAERPLLPLRRREPRILRRRFAAGDGIWPSGSPRVAGHRDRAAPRMYRELGLPSWQARQMRQPVESGQRQRHRRQAARQPSLPRLQHAIQVPQGGPVSRRRGSRRTRRPGRAPRLRAPGAVVSLASATARERVRLHRSVCLAIRCHPCLLDEPSTVIRPATGRYEQGPRPPHLRPTALLPAAGIPVCGNGRGRDASTHGLRGFPRSESCLWLGEPEAEAAVLPPGDGGVGAEVGLAQDG